MIQDVLDFTNGYKLLGLIEFVHRMSSKQRMAEVFLKLSLAGPDLDAASRKDWSEGVRSVVNGMQSSLRKREKVEKVEDIIKKELPSRLPSRKDDGIHAAFKTELSNCMGDFLGNDQQGGREKA